ncbi:hypothetical protein [Limosilactobacillus ingluviei]|uniref:hypothetical protein n=1 Tax=Limosilactobacillus ingluviei TaxID=148604 RepID=UPI0023F1B5D2|nr:hypothetical protein [Limosilactobacillus ingluviei]
MNYNKNLEISNALDSLKQKYPKAFEGNNRLLEDYVPPTDPDLKTILRMRDQIAIGDMYKLRRPAMKRKISNLVQQFPNMWYISEQLEINRYSVELYFKQTPEALSELEYCKRRYAKVKVLDCKNEKMRSFASINKAADYIGIPKGKLLYYLQSRHSASLINGRYQAKRALWYDVDGSMK